MKADIYEDIIYEHMCIHIYICVYTSTPLNATAASFRSNYGRKTCRPGSLLVLLLTCGLRDQATQRSTIDIWVGRSFVVRSCPVLCRGFSSVPGLCALDAHSILCPRQPKCLSDISRCCPGGEPLFKTRQDHTPGHRVLIKKPRRIPSSPLPVPFQLECFRDACEGSYQTQSRLTPVVL